MEEIKRFKFTFNYKRKIVINVTYYEFTFISNPLLKAKKGNHKIHDMNTDKYMA